MLSFEVSQYKRRNYIKLVHKCSVSPNLFKRKVKLQKGGGGDIIAVHLNYCSFFPGALNKLKVQHHEDSSSATLVANKPFLLRSLFTVGALGRHFDFDLEEFKGPNKVGEPWMSNYISYLRLNQSKVMDCH